MRLFVFLFLFCLGVLFLPSFVYAQATSTPVLVSSTAPTLGISIPGISFPEELTVVDGKILIPYLAIYISTVQKYLIGLALIAAAVIIVYAGVLYMAASTGAKVHDAKELIKDALIGLVLILTAVVILFNLNPQTTEPSTLSVYQVKRIEDTPENPAQAYAWVEESATRYPDLEIRSVSADGSDIPAPAGGKTEIIKNPKGEFVAQGECPPDMILIRHNPSYTPPTSSIEPMKNVPSFCIDRFEAPNRKDVLPYIGVIEPEADLWCSERGKRLCTRSEWVRACMGPEGKNTYGYGDTFIPGKNIKQDGNVKSTNNPPAPCNYDSAGKAFYTSAREKAVHALDFGYFPKDPKESALNPKNPKLQDPKFKERVDLVFNTILGFAAHEPSGNRPQCVTAEGVFDMAANTQEIVLSDAGGSKTLEQRLSGGPTQQGSSKPYRWVGFYWNPYYHGSSANPEPRCTNRPGVDHSISWRGHENGFRCCLDLEN